MGIVRWSYNFKWGQAARAIIMFYKSQSINKVLSQQNIPAILESVIKYPSKPLHPIMLRFKNIKVDNSQFVMVNDGKFSYRFSLLPSVDPD